MTARLKADLHINEEFLKRVRDRLMGAPKHVHNHRITVGLHEQEGSAQAIKPASGQPNTNEAKVNYGGNATSTPLVDVAMDHEFGYGVPNRSWLRTWFDQNLARLKVESTTAMRAEYQGDAMAVENLAKEWGQQLQNWIQENVAGLEPLKESTIQERQKAGLPPGPPLFATGQLVRAIRAIYDGSYV